MRVINPERVHAQPFYVEVLDLDVLQDGASDGQPPDRYRADRDGTESRGAKCNSAQGGSPGGTSTQRSSAGGCLITLGAGK
jgi:hypothetical protein